MLLTVKVERVRLVFRLNAFDFLRKKVYFETIWKQMRYMIPTNDLFRKGIRFRTVVFIG